MASFSANNLINLERPLILTGLMFIQLMFGKLKLVKDMELIQRFMSSKPILEILVQGLKFIKQIGDCAR